MGRLARSLPVMRPLRVTFCVACIVLVVGSACSDSGADPDPSASVSPSVSPTGEVTFDVARALIDTDEGSVLIEIEIADTNQKRQLGLMFRDSLEEDAGMAFIFFEETDGAFWMKNTKIPLSIAFFDAKGAIVRILDMEPCTEEPCELYSPGVSYHGALEVNQGAFDKWGVTVGDRITIAR